MRDERFGPSRSVQEPGVCNGVSSRRLAGSQRSGAVGWMAESAFLGESTLPTELPVDPVVGYYPRSLCNVCARFARDNSRVSSTKDELLWSLD